MIVYSQQLQVNSTTDMEPNGIETTQYNIYTLYLSSEFNVQFVFLPERPLLGFTMESSDGGMVTYLVINTTCQIVH